MDKPTVWIKPGIVSIFGTSFDAASHSHQAIQLVWPSLESLIQSRIRGFVATVFIMANNDACNTSYLK